MFDAVFGRRSRRRGSTIGIDEGDLEAEALELRPLGSRFTVEGVPVELNVPG